MIRITGDWITNPATQSVCAALARDGAQVFFVGGCVRNALLGAPISDIDLATDAPPQTVSDLASAAGIKVVPTGLDHGTVTLVLDGVAHEVTTFRRDLSTDGRRATVTFSRDVAQDAARRDFTMNALYARPDGTLVDPLNGLPDLRARRVRFIGDARDRIREDYLRSLRYFRFHAWYGDPGAGFDPGALAAIAGNLSGLQRLSRERIGSELLKLLAAPDPAPACAAMRSTGVLGQVLPGADDRALGLLVHLESQAGADPEALRRLAALGGTDVMAALRLSRSKNAWLTAVRTAATGTAGIAELGFRLPPDQAQDALLLRCALAEQPWPARAAHLLEKGAQARFPVSAQDLMPEFQGPALGAELARLQALWIASDFTLDRAALLAR
ncbi:CCA tRNA nucleotidyltransferase [Sedimentitalea sp. HM32M-2]|uniref:CCA tRNA nucleotidyltransferase n=1 Tax=Sedimentitalea sp. HM32M-2 TaxID=3351566 RepID=UPI00363E43C6